MDTLTRREFLTRLARVAVAGPVVIATRETQAELLWQIAQLCGRDSAIGRWLIELSFHW